MKIGIIGLGLIGGSLAKAFKEKGHTVLGYDTDRVVEDYAIMSQGIHGELKDEDISSCDAIFIAITISQAKEWLKLNGSLISPGTLVIDCCGVKKNICRTGFAQAEKYGFTFMGGHPMAGKQVGGYKNSSPSLFEGAVFVMVPKAKDDIRLLTKAKSLLMDAGFTQFAVMSPPEHDRVIAFTSQMAHLLSNAYIKSDMAEESQGVLIAGGAFRDMTRVAYLDEDMWTELFMENRKNLLNQLRGLMAELEKYEGALAKEDEGSLTALLAEGKQRKMIIERSQNEIK